MVTRKLSNCHRRHPKDDAQVEPQAAEGDVHDGFEAFAFPEFGGVAEELEEEAEDPEDRQSQADAVSE